MNFLETILEKKRARVEQAKASTSFAGLCDQASIYRRSCTPHSLRTALQQEGSRYNIIAEFKRRSPSKGDIRPNADPVDIAKQYLRGGAAAVSVLTEEDYFNGSLADLRAVRSAVGLPVLRKDFVIDRFQLYESALLGADAVLLIVAALNKETLAEFRMITEDELGMDALVEVHTPQELETALNCGATLIGVNNRNLSTFEVSLESSLQLAELAPKGTILVSESGLRTAQDLEKLREVGYQAFLLGETLMRAERPEEKLRELTSSRVAVPQT